MKPEKAPEIVLYEFGRFRIDTSQRMLQSDDLILPLPPKAIDTLIYLLERPESVVPRSDLQAAVWPDVFVEENNLTQYISLLRKTLGDRLDSPEFIQTVARRGYRLRCPVRRSILPEYTANSPAQTSPEPISQLQSDVRHGLSPLRRRHPLQFAVAALALCSIAGYALVRHLRYLVPIVSAYAPVSLVVFPAEMPSVAPADKFSGVALADDLIRCVGARRPNAHVVPITAVRGFAGQPTPPIEVAQRLGATFAVNMKLTPRSASRVRLSATLLRTSDGAVVWSGNTEDATGNVIAMERRLAAQLEKSLWGTDSGNALPPEPITQNLAAYSDYLRGQAMLDLRTSEGIYKGLDALEQAVAADPGFAEGYSALAAGQAYDLGIWKKAEANAQKALSLNPRLASAHAVRGLIHLLWLDDCPGAATELKKALLLNPQDPLAHLWYADVFGQLGRYPEALEEIRIARDMDPYSLPIATAQARISFYDGKFDVALEQCRHVLAMDPNYLDGHLLMFRIQVARRADGLAVEEFRSIEKVAGNSALYKASQAESLDRAYVANGMNGFWLARLQYLSHQYSDDYELAVNLAALGRNNEALRHLARAMKSRKDGRAPILFARNDPAFAGLRGNPFFLQITSTPGA